MLDRRFGYAAAIDGAVTGRVLAQRSAYTAAIFPRDPVLGHGSFGLIPGFQPPRRLAVSEQTVEAPRLRIPDALPHREQRERLSALALLTRYPWVTGGIALVAISTAIVLYARTRPGYDPYGWLVWGHLTLHWKLNTNGAPSWKPLPYVFTLPYGLVGHYAMWLWMITAVAITLAGPIFAWRLAFRLTAASPARRYAAYVAGLVAALGVLGIRDYSHFVLSYQSDSMIVSICLAAIDCWLCGRLRWALWLWTLGSLGRPEVWPFMGVYSIWLWRIRPELRRQIVLGILVIPLMWFGIPGLTSKSPFTAGNLAQNSPRALKSNKFFGTWIRFFHLHQWPIQVAALLTVVLAIVRRQRVILLLAAGAVFWILLEAAFALHGWPSVPRYLFEPVAVTCVLAGVFVGRFILELPPLIRRAAIHVSALASRPHLVTRLGSWGVILGLVLFGGSMLPPLRERLRKERADIKHERVRTKELGRLSVVVQKLGASHILSCGKVNIPIGYQSTFAFYMGTDTGMYYIIKSVLRAHPRTLVNIYPLSNGWRVFPSHVTPADAAKCRGLTLTYRA